MCSFMSLTTSSKIGLRGPKDLKPEGLPTMLSRCRNTSLNAADCKLGIRDVHENVLQCLPDLTNSVLTNHPGLTNWFLTSNIFLLHNNFGFSEFPDLTNNSPGPN